MIRPLAAVLALSAAAAAPAAAGPPSGAGGPPAAAAGAGGHRTYILCLPRAAANRERRSHPRRCTTLGPHDSFAASANLARLRWRGWGRRAATARGIERGFHLPLQHVRVRVRAYRRRAGCGDARVYTRMRVTSEYGHVTIRYHRRCHD